MGEWLRFLLPLTVALLLLTLPGLPVALVLRLRGFARLAAAVAASVAAIAVGSIAAPLLGAPWGVLPVAAAAGGLTALAALARLLDNRLRPRPPAEPEAPGSRRIAGIAAVAIPFLTISWVLVRGFGAPGNFAQLYDNVFHLNAVAWILDTGDASPFAMHLLDPGAQGGFYPTVWHAAVALVTQLAGASIPVTTNALSIAVSAWVWPVAVVFFARPFFRDSPAALVAAGILSAAFSAFPFRVFAWGILYPNLLSTALIPVALGFLHMALRPRAHARPAGPAAAWLAAIGATGAAALAHPNALLGLFAISAPLFVAAARDGFRSGSRPWLRLAAIAATLAAFAVVWRSIHTTDNNRVYGGNPVTAALSALANAPITPSQAWFVTVFVLGGALLLWLTRRHRWLVVSYGVLVLLFAVSAGTSGALRDFLTEGWYNDANRLAFLLPIAAVPLAARAAAELLGLVELGARRWRPLPDPSRISRLAPRIAVPLTLLLLLTGTQGPSIAAARQEFAPHFELDEASPLVSTDELRLFERLPETTPEDALILGDPFSGAALAYALGDRDVVFPHLKGSFPEEARELAREFREIGGGACPLLQDLGVTHVIDSTDPLYQDGRREFEGLDGLDGSPLLTRVDREGGAVLYEVTGCG